MTELLPDIPLPSSIRSRFVEGINGLRMHVLEAGYETRGRPCVLLLHGFPELAYSWRKVMPRLGGGRLSRDRAGPARLRPHHRLEREITTATSTRSGCSTWSATRSGWSSAFGYRTSMP